MPDALPLRIGVKQYRNPVEYLCARDIGTDLLVRIKVIKVIKVILVNAWMNALVNTWMYVSVNAQKNVRIGQKYTSALNMRRRFVLNITESNMFNNMFNIMLTSRRTWINAGASIHVYTSPLAMARGLYTINPDDSGYYNTTQNS